MPINTTPFYHSSTRNIIAAFGTLFNNMKVTRENNKTITIPLIYSSKEKWYTRKNDDKDLNKSVALTLPRMGFIITDYIYDSARKTSSKIKMRSSNTLDNVNTVFAPVPYNLSVELYIQTKHMTDGLQLIEQILPYFKPSFVVTIVEMQEPRITRDIPITLTSIAHTDSAEGSFDTTRVLEWNLYFEIEANFFGPVSQDGIIKTVYVDTHMGAGDWDETTRRLTGTPDPSDAEQNDAWVFSEAWEDYPDR